MAAGSADGMLAGSCLHYSTTEIDRKALAIGYCDIPGTRTWQHKLNDSHNTSHHVINIVLPMHEE